MSFRARSNRFACALKVDVEVAGGAAETRVQMEFFNPNSRVLEGKLQFPLAAGQVVSGFALDVDGQMRDAVPVDKARAEQVFEDIARRRVDPGLLQTSTGNNYELRPLSAAAGQDANDRAQAGRAGRRAGLRYRSATPVASIGSSVSLATQALRLVRPSRAGARSVCVRA